MMDCNKYPQIVWKWALAILIIRCNLQFGGGLGGNSEHVVDWLASRSHFDHQCSIANLMMLTVYKCAAIKIAFANELHGEASTL